MGMNTTQNARTVRPTRIPNGKISAMSMVKAMIASGVNMAGTPLAAQLTDAERIELGL